MKNLTHLTASFACYPGVVHLIDPEVSKERIASVFVVTVSFGWMPKSLEGPTGSH
jgi:hypothetical protein